MLLVAFIVIYYYNCSNRSNQFATYILLQNHSLNNNEFRQLSRGGMGGQVKVTNPPRPKPAWPFPPRTPPRSHKNAF